MDKARLVLYDERENRVVGVGDSVSPEVLERLLKDVKGSEQIKAKFKIEVHFGQDRSISALKPSTGALLVWESGKRFHGGGDDMMYWCGYEDCDTPFTSDNFAIYSVVCPSCMRESFLDGQSKSQHLLKARRQGASVESFKAMPVVTNTRLFKSTPPKIAELIEKVWRKLGCNADIYLKYHPSDIRYKSLERSASSIDELRRARELRGLHIYPLARILKDTQAGADPRRRFLAFITA